jgi:hypothetical protein
MISADALLEFLGWCTVINMVFLLLASIVLGPMRGAFQGIHAKIFGLSEEDVSRVYFQYLAQYKIAIAIFNLVPWIALSMIA